MQISPEFPHQFSNNFSAQCKTDIKSKPKPLLLGRICRDRKGQELHLFINGHTGVQAVLKTLEGNVQILPLNKIHNGLNPEEIGISFIQRILRAKNRCCDMSVDVRKGAVHIWPHIKAAAWDEIYNKTDPKDYNAASAYFKEKTLNETTEWFYQNGYHTVSDRKCNQDSFVFLRHPESKSKFEVITSTKHEEIKNLLDCGYRIFELHDRNDIKDASNNLNRSDKPKPFFVGGVAFQHPEEDHLNQHQIHIDWSHRNDDKGLHFSIEMSGGRNFVEIETVDKHQHKFIEGFHVQSKGSDRSIDDGKNGSGGGGNSGGKGPSGGGNNGSSGSLRESNVRRKDAHNKAMQEKLQRHRLTESYNSSHPRNLMASKPNNNGQIGGVATSAGIIKKLFSGLHGLFESEHIIVVPALNGKPPFSISEMEQLAFEIATGIYEHDAVPFFSLDFNAEGHLVPVLHQIYDNTLVGRVISLLDYFMKGYLNGGVFPEEFIHAWQAHRQKNGEDLFQNIIDFQKYTQEHLKLDNPYSSLRQLLINMQILQKHKGDEQEDLDPISLELEEDCNHLRSSFRIIANQRSIQKHGNVLVVDSDFEVFSTLEPEPAFVEKVRQHQAAHGKEPQIMIHLRKAHEIMCRRIKEEMPQLPLCRELFSMLGVISFLSHYFTTLKAKGKTPTCKSINAKATPVAPLFPALPLRAVQRQEYKVRWIQVLLKIEGEDFKQLEMWLRNSDTTLPLSDNVLQRFTTELISDLQPQLIHAIRHELATSEGFKKFSSDVSSFLKNIRPHIISDFTSWKESCLDLFNMLDMRQYLLQFNPEKARIVPEAPFSFSREVLILADEIEKKEKKAIEKVVGGCGLRFSKIKVIDSPKAALYQAYNSLSVDSFPNGDWKPLYMPQTPDAQAYAFLIPFQELPFTSNGDYTRFSQNLKATPEQVLWRHAVFAIEKDDLDGLKKLELSNEFLQKQNENGETFLHIAASLEKPQICKHLLETGLSVSTEDQYGQTSIHAACSSGSYESLVILLEVDKEASSSIDKYGQTPLHVAIRHGQKACIELLFDCGADVNVQAHHDLTPLLAAFHYQRWDIVKMLILHPSIDLEIQTSEGQRAIHEAVENKNEEIVALLLQKNAAHSPARRDGFTPLHLAALYGEMPIFSRLVNHGVDIMQKSPIGDTVLHLAVQAKNIEMCQFLFEKRPSLNSIVDSGNTEAFSVLQTLIAQKPELLYILNSANRSALLQALLLGDQEIALLMIEQIRLTEKRTILRLDPISLLNMQDDEKNIPLLVAAGMSLGDAFCKLLEAGAVIPPFERLIPFLAHMVTPAILKELEKKMPLSEQQKHELLLASVQHGNYWIAMNILQSNPPLKVEFAMKVFEACVEHDFILPAQLLLQHHKEFAFLCYRSKGILAFSAAFGSRAIFKWALQQYKSEKAVKDAMQIACQRGQIDCAEKLYLLLPHPDAVLNNKGMTAIHFAASGGHEKLVELLLNHGCSSQITDSKGRDALDHAFRNKKPEILKILILKKHQIHAKSLALSPTVKILKKLAKDYNFEKNDVAKAIVSFMKKDDVASVQVLLHCGIEMDEILYKEWTPLTYAAAHGHHKVLEHLLQLSGRLDHFVKGKNALHHAVEGMHFRCIHLLLSKGFDMLCPDEKGQNCITLARDIKWLVSFLTNRFEFEQKIKSVQDELGGCDTKKLVELSNDLPLDQPLFRCPDGKYRPLLFAAILSLKEPTSEVVENIIKDFPYPDPAHLVDEKGRSISHFLAQKHLAPLSPFSPDKIDKQGRSALHIYAAYCSVSILEKAIEGISNVDILDENGTTPLYQSVCLGSDENVVVLLKAKANPNIQVINGATPLTIAVTKGYISIVKLLLHAGAKISNQKMPLLHIALEAGHGDIALLLIKHGANIQEKDQCGNFPAHFAAKRGHLSILHYLSAKGQSLACYNNDGLLPAHLAAKEGQVDVLTYLGENIFGDDTKFVDQPKPYHIAGSSGNMTALKAILAQGQDPFETAQMRGILSYAVKSGVQETIDTLLKTRLGNDLSQLQWATIDAIMQDNTKALESLQKQGVIFNLPIINKCNALHLACEFGKLRTAAFLINEGIDGSVPNGDGKSCLEIASENNNPTLLRYLLLLGLPCSPDKNGKTLLHRAASNGCLRNVAVLLDYGFNVNEQDIIGFTALHMACQQEHFSIMELLLFAGADFQMKTITRKEPGELIPPDATNVRKKWYERVDFVNQYPPHTSRLLLSIKLKLRQYWPILVLIHDVNVTDEVGQSLLHIAALERDHLLMRLLLKAHADVNVKNDRGISPLDIAAFSSRDVECTSLLLGAGAAIDSKGKEKLNDEDQRISEEIEFLFKQFESRGEKV